MTLSNITGAQEQHSTLRSKDQAKSEHEDKQQLAGQIDEASMKNDCVEDRARAGQIDEANMKNDCVEDRALEKSITDNQSQQDKIEVSTENQEVVHESEDGVEDTAHENEDFTQQEPVEAIEKNAEEVDPYAQQKAGSSATIDKVAKLVTKIEETVTRHKIKANSLKLHYENALVFDQKLHQAAKTNRYDTGMSSEFLMKHLMQLDNCLSYGCGVIRSSRKALVCRIKEIMAQADSLSQQWLKHVQGLEKLKAEKTPAAAHIESTDEIVSIEERTGDKVDADTDEASQSMDVEESSADDDVDEKNTVSENSHTTPPCSFETETKQRESVRLPLWKPRTQMYHGDSHVIVAAFVPGMTMDQLNVTIDETDMVVTGEKHPTMQDIISYRQGRGQNFGNLKLKIPLPTDVVRTEGATATYADNVLRVKFLKKRIPQHYRQSPWQQACHQSVPSRRPMRYRHPMYYQQPKLRQNNFFNHPPSFW